MPGNYGPGGKWVHDRAHEIMKQTTDEYGEEKGKRVAYAMATLQAHRLGKTPKHSGKNSAGPRFGTPQGRAKARNLYHKSRSEYKKTAASFLAELVLKEQGK